MLGLALRRLALAAVLLLASCRGPVEVPCEPAACEGQCGVIDDGCGGSLECACPSPCDGGECDGGVVPDAGCEGLSCCESESGAAFCARTSRTCGYASGEDNCGRPRWVDCGGCTFPQTCGSAGSCGCQPRTCAQAGRECGEAYDECGQFIHCGACPDGGTPPPHRLRIMAANITTGNRQSYDPGEGIRIFQGLKPDLVLIQEFNYGSNTPQELRQFVDTTFGPSFFYYREEGGGIPNGVISRYPIVASGEWDDGAVGNRDFAWARIDVPGPIDLWAVSLHLLTSNQSERAGEASQLVGYLNSAVPAADLLVVGGDFNTNSRAESCISALSQKVVTSSPYPVDQANDSDTNASRTSPYDWVLVDSDLKAKQVPVTVGSASFPAGLVFDSRVFTPLSAVPPVLVTDSAGPSMQHMAVIRDFHLP